MTREGKIQLLSLLLLLGFLVAVIHQYRSAVYEGLQYPRNTFLFQPTDRFNDFRNIYNLVLKPENTANPLYQSRRSPFQFSYVVTGALAFLRVPTNIAAAACLTLFAAAIFLIVKRCLKVSSRAETWKNSVIVTVLTYPFLLAIDRGNLEALVFLFVFVFAWALQAERDGLAVVALGIAIALKPFPVVFLALFLRPLRVAPLFGVGALAVGLNFLAILARFGSFSAVSFDATGDYHTRYALGDAGLAFGHSLWGVLKIGVYMARKVLSIPLDDVSGILISLSRPYFVAALVLGAAVVVYTLFCEPVFWKKVALLVCLMNLLPFVSADYKLLHLYVPLLLFIGSPVPEKLDGLYVWLFALLLVPKAYLYFFGEVNLGVVLNPLLMLTLVLVIVVSGCDARRQSRTRHLQEGNR